MVVCPNLFCISGFPPSDKDLTLAIGEQVITLVAVTVIPVAVTVIPAFLPFIPKEKQGRVFLLVALIKKSQPWEEQPENTPRVITLCASTGGAAA